MAEAEITVPDVCFQTFPWKKMPGDCEVHEGAVQI